MKDSLPSLSSDMSSRSEDGHEDDDGYNSEYEDNNNMHFAQYGKERTTQSYPGQHTKPHASSFNPKLNENHQFSDTYRPMGDFATDDSHPGGRADRIYTGHNHPNGAKNLPVTNLSPPHEMQRTFEKHYLPRSTFSETQFSPSSLSTPPPAQHQQPLHFQQYPYKINAQPAVNNISDREMQYHYALAAKILHEHLMSPAHSAIDNGQPPPSHQTVYPVFNPHPMQTQPPYYPPGNLHHTVGNNYNIQSYNHQFP